MNHEQKRRRRLSPEEKRQLIAEWKASDLSGREFSERVGINVTNLWRWKGELESAAPHLVPVVVRSSPSPRRDESEPRGAQAELVCRGGRVVRVFVGCDQELLRAVVAAAEEAVGC